MTSERQQKALRTAHTLRCINTHGHTSSKHTLHLVLSTAFYAFHGYFPSAGPTISPEKKKKKKAKTKQRHHLNCRREMCYALQMVNEITFIIKTKYFTVFSLGVEEGCRIHKQGLIKHDFQRLYGERGAVKGQTEMFCSDERGTVSPLLYTTQHVLVYTKQPQPQY